MSHFNVSLIVWVKRKESRSRSNRGPFVYQPSALPLGHTGSRIISGLEETFIKRHIIERTNKAEIRPEEQSEKSESCRENLWNEIQLKGP